MLTVNLDIAQLRSPLRNGWKPGDALPKRLKIFNWGENASNHPQGNFVVNDDTVAVLASNQRLLGRERIPIGFEHNIDPGSEEYNRTQEPRPIAAQGTVEVVPGDGVYLSALTWTPDGEKTAANYEDISPTPLFDKSTGTILALNSASLTRTGSVYDLTLLSAGAQPVIATLSAHYSAKTQPAKNMNTTISIATLAAALKCDATEEAVVARIAAGALPQIFEITVAGKVEKLTGAQLAAKMVDISALLQNAETARTSGERAAAVARLGAAGKVPVNPATRKAYTAEELGALELPTLALLEANTPATVPLSARRAANVEAARAIDPKLTGLARLSAAFHVQNLGNPEYVAWREQMGRPVLSQLN